MGFSIGSLLGGLAPIVGGLLGGPVGVAIGGAIGSAFVRPQARLPSQAGPTARRGSKLPQLLLKGAAGVGTIITMGELLNIARENSGRRVTSKIIRDSVRVCGIEVTAATFGLSTEDICRIAVTTGRRRSRGISAVDLRRTRSTLRKVSSIQRDLKAVAAGRKIC